MTEQQTNIKFVLEVQKHPCLYNPELTTYSRKDVMDQAWEEIGEVMKMSGAACKEKWKNLRTVFMRNMKPPLNVSGRRKPYYLSEAMQFLIPYLKPSALGLPSTSNESKESDNEDAEEMNEEISEVSDAEINPRKRKHDPDVFLNFLKDSYGRFGRPTDANDPVRSFLNSLVPELNEMNHVQFKAFKRRVLMLIDDIMDDVPNANYFMKSE